jgi:predicted dehydrogenase
MKPPNGAAGIGACRRARPQINAGIIGGSGHAHALVDHLPLLPRLRLARWTPSPGQQDASQATALAQRAGVGFVSEWQAVAHEPSIEAVLVLSDAPEGTEAVQAALAAGKAVLCPAPAARTEPEVDRLAAAIQRGQGLLFAPGAIRHTPAGRYALRVASNGSLGGLHSIYAAARSGTRDGDRVRDVVEEMGWDIFDFVIALTDAPVRRVHAAAAGLFQEEGGVDTAALIVRFDDELVATIELARCLPPGIAAEAEPEVEIEVIAARQALRIEPYRTAVRVYRCGERSLRPWIDAPALSMVQDLIAAIDGEATPRDSIDRQRRLVEVMSRVAAAAAERYHR